MSVGENEILNPFVAYGNDDRVIGYLFFCPGCDRPHAFRVFRKDGEDGPKWTFNGDLKRPTFEPSYLTWEPTEDDPDPNRQRKRCHLFLRDGKIQYLDDCFHGLRGQTIDVPPFHW